MIELATMGIWATVTMLMLVLIKLGAMHQTMQISNDMQECQMGTAKASSSSLADITHGLNIVAEDVRYIRQQK